MSRVYSEYNDPWEWEPIPSERSEAYLARCRFESVEEALSHWDTWLERRGANERDA